LIRDRNGKLSQAKIVKIDPAHPELFIENFIPSPTLDVPRQTVTKGDFLTISGYANAGAAVIFQIDGKIADGNVTADADGAYKILYNTAGLDLGNHSAQVKQVAAGGKSSDLSVTKNFKITDLFIPATDFNQDGKVDIHDASVFISLWLTPESETAKDKIDFNHDGKVDLQDFSIFIRNLKLK
jgi:hypothetical protein